MVRSRKFWGCHSANCASLPRVSDVVRRQVSAKVPGWNAEVVLKLLDFKEADAGWAEVTETIKTMPRNQLRYLWFELVSKSEPPTFHKGLGYIKRWLERKNCEFKAVPSLECFTKELKPEPEPEPEPQEDRCPRCKHTYPEDTNIYTVKELRYRRCVYCGFESLVDKICQSYVEKFSKAFSESFPFRKKRNRKPRQGVGQNFLSREDQLAND